MEVFEDNADHHRSNIGQSGRRGRKYRLVPVMADLSFKHATGVVLIILLTACAGSGPSSGATERTNPVAEEPTAYPMDGTSTFWMGKGWHCYQQTYATGEILNPCHRRQDRCEIWRQKAEQNGIRTTACRFERQAYCVIIGGNEPAGGAPICQVTLEDCNFQRSMFKEKPGSVSRCRMLD